MKSKEVEERVGLTKSNIRFYEKEGLLQIGRDRENNYREYTEEDVERIIKIKNLRVLGVPIADIRRLFADEISLDDVMKECMSRIKEQERELKEIHKACENMMQKHVDIHTWDGEIESDSKEVWRARLDEIFEQDKIYEPIAKEKMNRNITFMLLLGYGISTIMTTIFWPLFEKYQGYAGNGVPSRWGEYLPEVDAYNYSIHHDSLYIWFIIVLVISLACRGITFYTEKAKVQYLIFLVNSIIMAPGLLILIQWYEDALIVWNHMRVLKYDVFTQGGVCMFWVLVMFYVMVIYILSVKTKKLFSKKRYTIVCAMILSIIYAMIYDLIYCCFWGPLVAFGIVLFTISISWSRVNMEQKTYNRYETFTAANFILNPFGLLIQF